MTEKQGRWKRFTAWMRNRYRLVIMNDNTFEEKWSLRLTPWGVVTLVGSISIIMTVLVISLVAFTPLREYIPGYADVGMRRDLLATAHRLDSLGKKIKADSIYLDNLDRVLKGDIPTEQPKNPRDTTKNYKNLPLKPSQADSALRNEIESEDGYSLQIGVSKRSGVSGFFFFPPIKGIVTNSFNTADEHYGVDVAAPENEAIKSTLDGTVIMSGWTTDAGYVIQVQHSNNLVSVYKHNSSLLKKTGQYVKAGDPIAIIGSSGELTTGPHLHFELWYNGAPVDPQEYMAF
ncbi:MAG: peptidase M23 [Bacteroidetes bacterium]|nr:MAG: peptidase M23 [Bacteroidota bacterium]